MNTIKIWQNSKIFAALTGLKRPSANTKTGPMLQISILDKEDTPTQIIKKKKDHSVCGNCKLRGSICYLNPLSLNGIWKSAVEQIVSALPKALEAGRFGTYGNPSLIPLALVKKIADKARSWTGYTHEWETCDPQYSKYFMASIDPITAQSKGRTSIEDKAEANRMGYRTYRTIGSVKELLADEIHCPHEEKEVQCIDCGLCSGSSSKAKNIAIVVGGAPNKQARFKSHLKTIKELA